MKKTCFVTLILLLSITGLVVGCGNNIPLGEKEKSEGLTPLLPFIDTTQMPTDSMGAMVKYGYQLMMNTANYIGPNGINGKYLGNKMNCTNCHQNGGTKPYAFNLIKAHDLYPQYRAREAKVLTLAERVNNCVMRPHNGKPLPLDSREMVAFLSYLKWINGFVDDSKVYAGEKPFAISFPSRAASPYLGAALFEKHCQRCHGSNGEGIMNNDQITYQYPPLWGPSGYQPGSSMHRVIKQAQWIKVNMPKDSATYQKPFLTDEEAFDLAAFVNDDRIHQRPSPKTLDYPNPQQKAIDYGHPPFADTFPELWHKFGPYPPIIQYWKEKGLKPSF